jgi:hypothetical protein
MLYSVDINNYSNKFISSHWKFIKSRDDDFFFIEKNIPDKFDIIYLDTLHKADHIEKIFHFDSCTQGPYPVTVSNVLIFDSELFSKGSR